ncbi:unnamed protein product [Thlaspi arvense]|uniref:Uncharacterized protein n=1 Tax=Thlaspi arvense TaxID=13288 RepID=A0AAU9RU62_THLAR|nr:unnamed protein product [Thlaspi arvense]
MAKFEFLNRVDYAMQVLRNIGVYEKRSIWRTGMRNRASLSFSSLSRFLSLCINKRNVGEIGENTRSQRLEKAMKL